MRKLSAFFLFAAFSLSLTSAAFAEASQGEKSVTGFFRRLFNWGPKTVQRSADMTGHTMSTVGEKVVAKTGENTAEVLTGNVGETGNLVAEPVAGTLESSGIAVSKTAQAPLHAGEEDAAPAA
ncbi:MAG: hypothetical protein ACREH5_01920 [Candidatus Omnitrophota bacterium]